MAEDGPVPARHTDGHPDDETLAALDADALEPAAAAQVRDHVDGCAPCRATLADLQDVRARLGALPAPPLPAGVADRIDTALRTAAGSDRAASAVADLDRTRPADPPQPLGGTRGGRSRGRGRRRRGVRHRPVEQQPLGELERRNGEPAAHQRAGTVRRRGQGPGPSYRRHRQRRGDELHAEHSRGGGPVPRAHRGQSRGDERPGPAGRVRPRPRRSRPAAAGGPPRPVQGRDAYLFVFRTGTAHRAEVFVVGASCAASDAARQFRTSAAY